MKTLNFDMLESYPLEVLKIEKSKINEEFFKTFDRELSSKIVELNEAINNKFIEDIDLHYYTEDSILKIVNNISEEIKKYIDVDMSEKSLFGLNIKATTTTEEHTRGRLTGIQPDDFYDEYYVELYLNNIKTLHQLVKTLTHEIRHIYQYEYKLFDMFTEKEKYKYIDQPFEIDARNYVDDNFKNFISLNSREIYRNIKSLKLKNLN